MRRANRRRREQSQRKKNHSYSWRLVYALKTLERHCWRKRGEGWCLAAITVNLNLIESTSLTMQVKSAATVYGDRVRDRLKALPRLPRFFAALEDSADGSLHAHICMAYHPDDQLFIKKALKIDTAGSPSAIHWKTEYREYEPDPVQGDIDREMDREREAATRLGLDDDDMDTAEPYSLYNECDARGRYYRLMPIDVGWADYLSKHLQSRSENLSAGIGHLYVPRDLAKEANALHDEARAESLKRKAAVKGNGAKNSNP